MSQTIQQHKVFLKTFLIDSTLTQNGMKVNEGFLVKHIQEFVGKPVILTPKKDHPRELKSYIQTGNPDFDVPALMQFQDRHRIGKIVSVNPLIQQANNGQSSSSVYTAIVEIDTDRGLDLSEMGSYQDTYHHQFTNYLKIVLII